MTERAQQIWKAFCEELTQEPTDDMKEALATALRQAAHNNEVKYHQDDCVVDVVFYADELYDLADELEAL
jgi:hypothetical protein